MKKLPLNILKRVPGYVTRIIQFFTDAENTGILFISYKLDFSAYIFSEFFFVDRMIFIKSNI